MLYNTTMKNYGDAVGGAAALSSTVLVPVAIAIFNIYATTSKGRSKVGGGCVWGG